MPAPLYLTCLDDYHLGDPLFVNSLAQQMGRSQRVPRCLFVHGGGEAVERALEAQGFFPERRDEVLVPSTPKEAALIERAVREMTQRIVGALTDAAVHAVGFQGGDRGMLRSSEDGSLQAGGLGWLLKLTEQRVVPVVSTLVQAPGIGGWTAAPMSEVMHGLVVSLPKPIGVFFAKSPLPKIDERGGPMSLNVLAERAPAVFPDLQAAKAILAAGCEVLLTTVPGLFGGDKPEGIRIIPTKTP